MGLSEFIMRYCRGDLLLGMRSLRGRRGEWNFNQPCFVRVLRNFDITSSSCTIFHVCRIGSDIERVGKDKDVR